MSLNSIFLDFLAYDDTERIIRGVSEAFECPVMLVDSAFRVAAHACPPGFEDPVFSSAINRREMTYEFISMMKEHTDGGSGCESKSSADDESCEKGSETRGETNKGGGASGGRERLVSGGGFYIRIEGSSYRRRFSVLRHGGVLLGYLICVDVRGDLERRAENDLPWIEALIAKQMIFVYHRRQVISNDAEDVLCRLLDGEYKDDTYFQIQASSTFLASLEAERIAVISLEEYRSMNFMEDSLRGELRRVFYASHPFYYDNQVILFLNSRHNYRDFDRLIEEYRLRVVISDVFVKLYDMPKRYADAQSVMERILRDGKKRLAWAEDYHDVLLLSRICEAESLMQPNVSAIARHDAIHGTDYCRTLLSYLLNNRSLQRTCEELCMHRNTVLYRIDKIKDSFNLDLDDPKQQFSVTLSAAMAVFRQDEESFVQPRRGGANIK